jgi:ABC-2 type transport system permease protein
MPSANEQGLSIFQPDDAAPERRGVQQLGVVVEGRFDSYFSGRKLPPGDDAGENLSNINGLIERSAESARIVLFASNDFMDDQILNAQVIATGTQYLGPLELLMNTLDWSLRDDQLLQIRSQAHFNRTLPPMERQAQALIEYFNYALAILWLGLLALLHQLLKWLGRRRYRRELAL